MQWVRWIWKGAGGFATVEACTSRAKYSLPVRHDLTVVLTAHPEPEASGTQASLERRVLVWVSASSDVTSLI